MNWNDFTTALPILMPVLAAMGILVTNLRQSSGPDPLPRLLATGGLVASVVCSILAWSSDQPSAFGGALLFDRLAVLLSVLAAFCAIVTVLISADSLKRREKNNGEFYVLCLFACAGMQTMTASGNWLVLLLGIEIMSVAFYVLTGFLRENTRSVEASIKYFLTGSFATGLLLFGMALIFGGSNSLEISDLGAAVAESNEQSSLIFLGLAFLLGGLAFKIGAVPFHMWLPDVYEGAPTPITGFMATGVKVAALGAMLRIFAEVFQVESVALRDTLWWLAVLTMTIGNVAALTQKSVKRMLAYSSISHAGYLLIGIVSLNGGVPGEGPLNFSESSAATAILYYLIVYALANLGAFAVLSHLEARTKGDLSFSDLAGLRGQHPLAAFGMSLFMLSLAGIPGTGGFIGKFLILGSAVDTADVLHDESFVLLAVLGVLNSLVALYYYLRVPIWLYIRSAPEGSESIVESSESRAFRPVLLLTIVGTLWLGFGPDVGFGIESVLGWIRGALESLK